MHHLHNPDNSPRPVQSAVCGQETYQIYLPAGKTKERGIGQTDFALTHLM